MPRSGGPLQYLAESGPASSANHHGAIAMIATRLVLVTITVLAPWPCLVPRRYHTSSSSSLAAPLTGAALLSSTVSCYYYCRATITATRRSDRSCLLSLALRRIHTNTQDAPTKLGDVARRHRSCRAGHGIPIYRSQDICKLLPRRVAPVALLHLWR